MSHRVSVVIPAYNAGSTIERTLSSALAQTSPAHEIIVIDDGSSDNTLEVLRPYENRVTVKSQSNAGASAARNHGCRLATGDFIAFLDADDLWHPQKLAIQQSTFDTISNLVLSFTSNLTIREASAHNFDMASIPIQQPPRVTLLDNFDRLFLSPYFGTPNVMMRREHFVRCGGFDESLSTAEDVDLWIRASYGHQVARINEKLCVVVLQENSLSSRIKDSVYTNQLRVIDTFCKTHPEFAEASSRTVQRARALVYEQWGSGALCLKEHATARTALAQALRLSPSWRATYLMAKSILLL